MTQRNPLAEFADLANDVAIVTGATSGLGLRFARLLSACGARVAIAGRREDRLRALADELGPNCLPVATDMADPAQIERLADRAAEAFGTVTVAVNNAGVADGKRAVNLSLAEIDRLIDVNLRGPFLLSCAVARRLIEAKTGGRIVNVSSIFGSHYDGNGAALYSTTKAAVARMTETLAVEWAAFGINVNAVAPGMFESEMTDGMALRMGKGKKLDLSTLTKRKRLPTPDLLDSTLIYLVSPLSSAVTGTVVKVDDGQLPR